MTASGLPRRHRHRAAGRVLHLAHRVLDVSHAHPRHVVLIAFVAGLLSGAASAFIAAGAAVMASVLAANRRIAALAVAATLAGMGWADERTEALEGSALAGAVGRELAGELVALEPGRLRRAGGLSFRARWLDGEAGGDVGVVRLPPEATPRRDGHTAAPATATAVVVPGSVLSVSARIEQLAPWEAYQRLRGARAAIVVSTWAPTSRRRDGLTGALDAARDRSRRALSSGTGAAQGALLRGMVLGEDDAVADDVRSDFRRSGLAHLLAVSGQNVMLLATLAIGLATVAGASLQARIAFALALVVAYVPLAGGGPSIQRAGVMGAAGLVAALAGRLGDRWYALLLAAAITLAVNPLASRDPGWQLSFAAVIGLLSAARSVTRALVDAGVPRTVAEVTAITAVATVATAPLLVLHFGELSIVSLPANLLAAPAVAPVMWLGMLAAGIAQLDPALAFPLTWCNGHLVAYIEWVAHTAASVPHATVAVGVEVGATVATAGVVTIAALAALKSRWRRLSYGAGRDGALRRLWIPATVATATLVAAWLASSAGGGARAPLIADDELVVSFLDVGQGDATLLQTRRAAVLFDTGPPDGPVLKRLQEAGVRRLDALVLTHAQADHEGAAVAVIQRQRPRLVLNGGHGWPTGVQRALQSAVASVGARLLPVHAGQSIVLDGIGLETLWPPRADRLDVTQDPNETALVTHVRHRDFDLLLPADAESPVLRQLDLPRVEALKVSHHGSEDAGLAEVLDRLKPQVAAIEVGSGNSYGHPAPSTLATLSVVPLVTRTDVDGTTRLRVRAGTMELER